MSNEESVVPVDVYYNILHRIKDLTFLWTTCRSVSRDFRNAVDLVFIRHHLPKTFLTTDLGMSYSRTHGKVMLDASFAFDGLDATDPSIAVFREKDCHTDIKPMLVERLKEQFEYGNLYHEPRIIIEIRRLANDTPICDMQPDWDNLCLTANWKKMLSEFFAEEKAYNRILAARLDTVKPTLASMRDNPSIALEESLKFLFQSFASSDNDARRQVRSRRIRRNVWEHDHVEWTETDGHGFQAVKVARSNLGWVDFSDDEDEEPEESRRAEEKVPENDEEGNGDEDDWEDVEDDESDGDDDDVKRRSQEDDGRRTKRRTEGPVRPRRSKTPASLPPDQSTGPSPAPAGFAFTFKALPSA